MSVGRRIRTFAGVALVGLAILIGLATYSILTGLTPVKPTPPLIKVLMGVNLVLVLIMLGMLAWQIVGLLAAKRRGLAEDGLHIRLVSLFSLIAILPALLV